MAGSASRENGKRGGRPKGAKSASTITKEQARDAVRDVVISHMGDLMAAQISNAKGINYLVVREKATGKFLRVGKGRAEKVNPEEEIVEVWEKDPSVQAFTDLMNRALDKPKEQEQELKLTGSEALIALLQHGRKRAAESRNS